MPKEVLLEDLVKRAAGGGGGGEENGGGGGGGGGSTEPVWHDVEQVSSIGKVKDQARG